MLSSEVPGGHRGREVILMFVIAKLNAVGDRTLRCPCWDGGGTANVERVRRACSRGRDITLSEDGHANLNG